MNKKQLWNMFEKTGKIEYYLRYRSLCDKGIDNDGISESKGNYSR